MAEIAEFLGAVRMEFGWSGLVIALLVGGFICLAWWWQTKSDDGSKLEVRDSGNSVSTSQGGAGGSATATGGSITLHQHFGPFQPTPVVKDAPIDHTTGYGSTGAYIAAQPPEERDNVLSTVLPDVRVEVYTGGPDVTCLIVNKGGAAGKVTVKARLFPVHSLFQIQRWYDVTYAIPLKAWIGETTVKLMHVSSDGRSIVLDGIGERWEWAEYQKLPYSGEVEPFTMELRFVVEPHVGKRPIERIRITYTHGRTSGIGLSSTRESGAFSVENLTP